MTVLTCPKHAVVLQPRNTRYGVFHACTYPGCTVGCWDGRTSTPADQETRTIRNECHCLFDPLWRDHKTGRGRRRRNAYLWLSKKMKIPVDDTHFGMFDFDQCRRALVFIREFIASGQRFSKSRQDGYEVVREGGGA